MTDWRDAIDEIEALRGALEEVRRRSSIGVLDSSHKDELEVVLEDICLFVDAVLMPYEMAMGDEMSTTGR